MTNTESIAIFWFRRDLRIEDNAGLFHALKENQRVLPLFIFDSTILDQLEDEDDARVTFIYNEVNRLNEELKKSGSQLFCIYGNPLKIFEALLKSHNVSAVYINNDYEPTAIARDEAVSELLKTHNSELKSFKDQVVFERNEVTKDDGKPYTVFTPFSKKWKEKLNKFYLKPYPVSRYKASFLKADDGKIPSLNSMGFKESGQHFPDRFLNPDVAKNYGEDRDFPGIPGTTRMGIHLRFGTVSIRMLVARAKEINETLLNEFIWREFYQTILYHFPQVVHNAFKPAYDKIEWQNDTDLFHKWCEGQTGYPIVDAGMRELNATGFMHNRVRMVTASFLTKHLLIDWRWGEAYFAKKLLDYDLASNNGGWQWSAGCGCDAAPYFRVFNPELQAKKFDPDNRYIRKWVPEFERSNYVKPIVDHKFARDRALRVYKAAVGNQE